jgi:hypothetical protein
LYWSDRVGWTCFRRDRSLRSARIPAFLVGCLK